MVCLFKKRLWQDQWYTLNHFYKKPLFACIDLTYAFMSLFLNPYRTCRKFLQQKGATEIYAYGETPLMTYQKMAWQCNVQPTDIWYELGSGRGKGCFWLGLFCHCKVIGIEWVPQFYWLSKTLKFLFRIRNVQFQKCDIEKAYLQNATIIYLYGIWPSISFPKGAKVISISEPIAGLTLIKTFWVRYPWGRTTAYLQIA